jgi:hypothetical protein
VLRVGGELRLLDLDRSDFAGRLPDVSSEGTADKIIHDDAISEATASAGKRFLGKSPHLILRGQSDGGERK